MKLRLLLAAGVLLAATASSADAILDGVADGEAHPYVVAIRTPDERGLCSGVKIGDRAVLTAGHCLAPRATVRVLTGPDATAPAVSTLGEIHRHPDWCAGCAGGLPGIDASDVAVVVTEAALPGPSALLPAPGVVAALDQGHEVTTVGYGFRVRPKDFTGVEILQRHRVVQSLVDANHRISGEYLRLSAAKGGPCTGDSGGPSLLGDTVVGLTAFTVNGNCAGTTYAQRLDLPAVRSFLDAFLP